MKKRKSIVGDFDTGQISFWLLVIWILFMFGHSMTPGDLSSQESSKALTLLLWAFHKLGMEAEWLTEHIVRKTAHFCEYGVFGILLSLYKNSRPKRRYGQRAWPPEEIYSIMLAVILVPLLDETIQLFVSGRSGQIPDVWLDMAGSAAGVLFSQMILLLLQRQKELRQRSQKRIRL